MWDAPAAALAADGPGIAVGHVPVARRVVDGQNVRPVQVKTTVRSDLMKRPNYQKQYSSFTLLYIVFHFNCVNCNDVMLYIGLQ